MTAAQIIGIQDRTRPARQAARERHQHAGNTPATRRQLVTANTITTPRPYSQYIHRFSLYIRVSEKEYHFSESWANERDITIRCFGRMG